MPKIDLKKELKDIYSASKSKAAIVEVPKLNYLMIDGEGDLILPLNINKPWRPFSQFLSK